MLGAKIQKFQKHNTVAHRHSHDNCLESFSRKIHSTLTVTIQPSQKLIINCPDATTFLYKVKIIYQTVTDKNE